MTSQPTLTFKTRFGPCSIRWSEQGISSLKLLDGGGKNRSTLKLPQFVRQSVKIIQSYFENNSDSLREIPLDLTGAPPFHRRIYEVARTVPAGSLCTYGSLAERAGKPGGARAVGQAMAKNPIPLIIPCHRVLASNFALHGFSAPGGLKTKQALLEREGVNLRFAVERLPPASTDEILKKLQASDPVLKRLIKKLGPPRFDYPELNVYQSLVRSIAYQQLTGKAAATIFGRFRNLFRDGTPEPERVLALSEEQLRSVGLSRSKALAIRDLSSKTLEGLVPTAEETQWLSDQEIIERISRVRGIGPWTVEMLLMFTLGRPDVFPVTDYGIRKGFAKLYNKRSLPSPDALSRAGQKWRPYRTLASWYLWRLLDTPA